MCENAKTLNGAIRAIQRIYWSLDAGRGWLQLGLAELVSVHPQVQGGDKICMLLGCNLHIILLESGAGYHFVSEASLHPINYFRPVHFGVNFKKDEVEDILVL